MSDLSTINIYCTTVFWYWKKNKTKWIRIYDREKRRYKSNKIDILPWTTIKTPYNSMLRPFKTMKRPYETTRRHMHDHKRSYKAATYGYTRPQAAIQYHNLSQKVTPCPQRPLWASVCLKSYRNIFCTILNFFCSSLHANNNNKNNSKTKWIWIYDRERRRYSAIKDHKMPFKAIKGHANSNDAAHSYGREK